MPGPVLKSITLSSSRQLEAQAANASDVLATTLDGLSATVEITDGQLLVAQGKIHQLSVTTSLCSKMTQKIGEVFSEVIRNL